MQENPKIRTVIFYKNHFDDFLKSQNEKVQQKIFWTIDLIEVIEVIPETYLKHLENTDGLYEVRIKHGSDIFRIFSFFDEGKFVILTNGFQKKTQKTPQKEILKALKIKKEYETDKNINLNNK